MECYNIRIFYYASGTQYRVYSKPVLKLSAEEKEMRREFPIVRKKKRPELIYCPFTGEYIEFANFIDEKERSKQVSLNRSKQNLIGICRANNWDYFVTFTFNPRLVDSSNYEEVCLKACKWLNNVRSRSCPDMKYVLVPELHKDGEHYHLHGLLSCCSGLQMTVSGKTDKKGNIIYNIPSWKYGWNTATEISHSGRVSNYISKYITKDTDGLLKGRHRYWCSNNTFRMDDVSDELYIPDCMGAVEKLVGNISHIKSIHVVPCNRDIWYIECNHE